MQWLATRPNAIDGEQTSESRTTTASDDGATCAHQTPGAIVALPLAGVEVGVGAGAGVVLDLVVVGGVVEALVLVS